MFLNYIMSEKKMSYLTPIINAYVLLPFILYNRSVPLSTVVWIFCIPYIWINLINLSLIESVSGIFEWVLTFLVLIMVFIATEVWHKYININKTEYSNYIDIVALRFELAKIREELEYVKSSGEIYNSV